MPSRKPLARGLYEAAREQCAALGSDTELAMERAAEVPLSLHCWQGDDVRGFDQPAGNWAGGGRSPDAIPGKARTPDELRAVFDQASGAARDAPGSTCTPATPRQGTDPGSTATR